MPGRTGVHAGGSVVGGSELGGPQHIDLMTLFEVAKYLLPFQSHWHGRRLQHSASLRPMPFGSQFLQNLRPRPGYLHQQLDQLPGSFFAFANRITPG
jgi:hypothetical protein